jgi:hypothetical protein
MISRAREHAPGAEFHVADASAFHLPREYDAATCTFDSLNHLLARDRLEAALRHTAAALKPGAPFVFDILFEEAYRSRWGEGFSIVRDDHVLTITGSGYDFRTGAAQCTVTMFRLIDGQWRRADATMREQCYPPAELDAVLRHAGFGEIQCYDARDLGMGGQLGEGRTFYVATKRASRSGARNSGGARPSSDR